MDPLVALDGIGVSLGGRPILRDISLALAPGSGLGIGGVNGSGKTTLLRVLATLIAPDRGEGSVMGAALGTREVHEVRSDIGMIGHTPALVPELTIAENLEHVCRLGGIDTTMATRALDIVGLSGVSHTRVEASSHGMKRRAEIAHLLIRRPRLLLLDEATSGLDADAKDLIATLIERTLEDGGVVAQVSHDVSQLGRLSDFIELSGGRLAA